MDTLQVSAPAPTPRRITRWQHGPVDRASEHFELQYGDPSKVGFTNWLPVALIGPPADGVVNVQLLLAGLTAGDSEIVRSVLWEIQSALIDEYESPGFEDRDPWAGAIRISDCTGNVYGPVHWLYFPLGNEETRPLPLPAACWWGTLPWWARGRCRKRVN
jgi:hypothetical protein